MVMIRSTTSRVRGAILREIFNRLGPRGKLIAIVGTLAIVMLILLDFTVLKGEEFASGSVSMADKEAYMVIPVEELFEDLYVTISPDGTRRQKYSLSFRLVDPNGEEVHADTDKVKGNRDCGFTFEPNTEGKHRLYVDHVGPFRGTSRTAKVIVYINDRRLISKLFD